jgi:hypothetical protein
MSYQTWIKGTDLQIWADKLEARQKLPALVRRLIHATIEKPMLTQFPADEGTQRRGWDGITKIETGNAWVPDGDSVWEMGADKKPEAKANADYAKRTADSGAIDIPNTTFVFVTPRKWEGKTKWCEDRKAEGKWRDVRVFDCDDLEQWLETAPAVDAWLARMLGKLPVGVEDITSYWEALSSTSDPSLPPAVFLAGREKCKADLAAALGGAPAEIPVSALSLQELRDFIAAVIASEAGEIANAAVARMIIVRDADGWRQLAGTKNRLILIAGDELPLDRALIAEAVNGGHCVISLTPYTYVRSGIGVRLPRADRWEMQKAMQAAGFDEQRSERIAREAGGCTSILIRLSSKFAHQITPEWARPDNAAPILPLVLLGAWSDRSDEDRNLVERVTGEKYLNIQKLATKWINQPDAPLRFVDGIYSFVSREDSWRLLRSLFTRDLLDLFDKVAVEILSEDDPRYEMPAQERFLAGIQNKVPKFSPHVREGIAETIALLGTRGEQIPQGAPEGSAWRAAVIVRQLLGNASAQRWFSLSHLLPLLAEAAPDEFLSAIEADLRKGSPAIATLFEKDADGLFSSSPHTGLMWALEDLAWDPSQLSRVTLLLADIAVLDTGGRIHPRPAGVLHDIFRFWYPQTGASIDDRLQVLELLAKRKPEIAWPLLIALVHQGQDSATPGSKPRWRNYDSSQIRHITNGDVGKQVQWAANCVVSLATAVPTKWQQLMDKFAMQPGFVRDAVQKWLNETDPEAIDSNARIKIWERLRHLVREHRFFHDAFWALPLAKVDELAEIEKKWTPTDPVVRTRWLFGHSGHLEFGDPDTAYEERERMIEAARLVAAQEVFDVKGLDGLLELASQSEAPYLVGVATAKLNLVPGWQQILPNKLLPSKHSDNEFALAYVSNRIAIEGDPYVASIPLEDWSPEHVAEFALAMKFERKTWETLRRRKPDAEHIYWNRVNPHAGHLPADEVEEAATCLLNVKRPVVAATCMFSAHHANKNLDWMLVADVVDAASMNFEKAQADAPFTQTFLWELCELIKYLQSHPAANHDRLVRIEYRFLPLARHHNFSPKTLHAELGQNPAFFAELIEAQFCSKAEAQSKDRTVNPDQRAIARAAHDLLDSWTGIPGQRPDGSIDAAVLMAWVDDVRKLCTASDRIEICDVKIGEQLTYAPADPDGTWPCEAIREVIEWVPTDEILRGFDVGVSNQRGTHWKSITEGGEQERELARKYFGFADKLRLKWPRTALALRRIAESYELQAKREDERVEARD